MKYDLKKPCNECPFRKKSLPGWLGPWKPREILQSIAVNPFPCHRTIRHNEQRYEDDTLQSCAGMALFLNNNLEKSRDTSNAIHQWAVRNADTSIKNSVFLNTLEFMDHHTGLFKK